MIWSSPGIIVQCKFSHDSDYVIQYVLKIYDMVITKHHQEGFSRQKSTLETMSRQKILNKEVKLKTTLLSLISTKKKHT
jgi:hypothetical protein